MEVDLEWDGLSQNSLVNLKEMFWQTSHDDTSHYDRGHRLQQHPFEDRFVGINARSAIPWTATRLSPGYRAKIARLILPQTISSAPMARREPIRM